MNYLEANTYEKLSYMARLDHAARKSQIVRDSLEEILSYSEMTGLFVGVSFPTPSITETNEI